MGGWCAFSPGKAKRARCINAVTAGRLPLAERLATCEQVFAQGGLRLIVRITPFTQPADLDALLAQQGLRRFECSGAVLAVNGYAYHYRTLDASAT